MSVPQEALSEQRLIEALSEFIHKWFDETREEKLRAVEKDFESGSADIKGVIGAFSYPYIKLLEDEQRGFQAIPFLARLEFDKNTQEHLVADKYAVQANRRFKVLMIVLPAVVLVACSWEQAMTRKLMTNSLCTVQKVFDNIRPPCSGLLFV